MLWTILKGSCYRRLHFHKIQTVLDLLLLKQTGGVESFIKQSVLRKMVSKSSTEAELIPLSDAKQDNTSTIKLAENGKSNSDRTKHRLLYE